MTAAAYATREDVYRVGLPRGSIVDPARLVAAADPVTHRLQLEGHGFSQDTAVQLQVDLGGVLPTGLALMTIYYVVPVLVAAGIPSESLFQLAAAPGTGSAIAFTDAGTAPFRCFVPFGQSIDRELEQHSRWIDSMLPMQSAPLSLPVPSWITSVVAKRAAASLVRQLGLNGCQAILDEAHEVTLDAIRMAKNGIALRGDASAQVATNVAVSISSVGDQSRFTVADDGYLPGTAGVGATLGDPYGNNGGNL